MTFDECIMGAVVQLNSGGPAMTVSSMPSSDDPMAAVKCEWHGDDGNLRAEHFYLATIKAFTGALQ